VIPVGSGEVGSGLGRFESRGIGQACGKAGFESRGVGQARGQAGFEWEPLRDPRSESAFASFGIRTSSWALNRGRCRRSLFGSGGTSFADGGMGTAKSTLCPRYRYFDTQGVAEDTGTEGMASRGSVAVFWAGPDSALRRWAKSQVRSSGSA